MITTAVAVALACLAGFAVLRPLTVGRPGALHADADPDQDLRTRLLRQLRDLDEDLAAGKLTAAEHRELRGPVEAEAVAVLRRLEERAGTGELQAGLREIRPRERAAPRHPLRRRIAVAAGLLAAAGGVAAVLAGAVGPRSGGNATGDRQAVASDPDAAILAAQQKVKAAPGDAEAHRQLARRYLDAGMTGEAAIELLAVTRIAPADPEANTDLAILAFQAGQAADAKKSLDRVVAANPHYPEALYARGLVEVTGLHQAAAGRRDLTAYLAAAPYGAHVTEARTLLATAPAAGK